MTIAEFDINNAFLQTFKGKDGRYCLLIQNGKVSKASEDSCALRREGKTHNILYHRHDDRIRIEVIVSQDNDADWLPLREGCITGSKTGTMCAVNPYESVRDFFMYMWFWSFDCPFEGNEFTEHGKACEPLARKWHEDALGVKVEDGTFFLHRNPFYAAFRYSDDGKVYIKGILERLAEYKCPIRDLYKDIVPAYYMCQIQMGMEMLDIDWCDFVVVLFDMETKEFKKGYIVRVPRSREFWAWEFAQICFFMKYMHACAIPYWDKPPIKAPGVNFEIVYRRSQI